MRCKFPQRENNCQAARAEAITENTPANGVLSLEERAKKCSTIIDTIQKRNCFDTEIAPFMNGGQGPRFANLFRCYFPFNECSTEEARASSVNADLTTGVATSIKACLNKPASEKGTCLENAKTALYTANATVPKNVEEYIGCITRDAVPPTTTSGGVAPTGPCQAYDDAAKIQDGSKFGLFRTDFEKCDDPLKTQTQKFECKKAVIAAGLANTEATLKDVRLAIECRTHCGDLFALAVKNENEATVRAVKAAIDLCEPKPEAERRTCFDAVRTTHASVSGKILNYRDCRLPPPPAGPCDEL